MKYEAPDEYSMIIQAAPDRNSEPPLYELIQAVTSASNNPIFKHKRFVTALEDYRVNGVYTRPKPPPTEAQLQLYAERRKKMMADMVWQNRFIISALNK